MFDRKKKNFTILAIAVINFIIAIVMMNVITKKSIPINIFASDVIGKMQPKSMLLVLPVIVLIISIIQVFYRKKTMYKTVTTARLVEDGVFAFVDGLLITFNFILEIIGYNFVKTSLISSTTINPFFVLIIFIGLIVASISSTFPINRVGSILGLRTKETLKDDRIWRRANRFNGFTMFISAIILILLGFDFIVKGFNLLLLIVSLIISVVLIFVVPRIYVKIISSDKKDEVKEEIDK